MRHFHTLGGILLLYLLVIALPPRALGVANVAVLGWLLLVILHEQRYRRRWEQVVSVAGGVMAVATLMAAILTSSTIHSLISNSCIAIMGITAIALLAGTVARREGVDQIVVTSVLGIYLLLALMFSSVHLLLAALHPHYLNGTPSPPTASDTLYFSVITMTTVGFGDITPATSLARAVAAIEALVGQLYLVSVVSVAVARFQIKPRGGAR